MLYTYLSLSTLSRKKKIVNLKNTFKSHKYEHELI